MKRSCFYADFEQKKGVIMLPPFADPGSSFPERTSYAEANMPICKQNLDVLTKDFEDRPVSQNAPQSSIYYRDDIQLGSENTLICHSTRFFPPPVTVRWTKNSVDVTDKSTLGRYYLNKDNTFNQFSHLPFTPQEGDIYTCTVEHKALETPDTKTLVEPQVEVKLVKKSDGSHPAILMCSAYSFYPQLIKVTWLRNDKEVKGGQTSTEEMPDGDWYYQIHSHLEYMPESGEKISCVVEHASFKKPMEYKWDPSMSEPDKSKIAIGASGLVLGIVLSAAGFIYYKRKSSDQHLDFQLAGCSESDKEFEMEHDQDEIFHSDFQKQDLVIKLPKFADPLGYPGVYDHSVSEQEICKHNLDVAVTSYKNPPEAVVRFFPPPVRIRWMRNGEDVTDKSTLSQFYPNEDNTYNQFSHLPFIPQEGDIYTCTVEHKALETPDTKTLDGYYHERRSQCFYSSRDLSDMVVVDSLIFNKVEYIWFNSTVGKFQGYTRHGIYNAELVNNDTAILQQEQAEVENFCKHNAQIYYPAIIDKSVEPQVTVKSVRQSHGSHPALLVCSAYSFYPRHIKVTWLRNNKEVKGGQTSTEEMPDGDWYYQIHSHLEYMPESGEEISCVVEHASFKKPMVYKWDPSASAPDKSKIAIGASGLVLGIVISAAGFIYYKRKSSGTY
ncbi:DLA class II histocompatibility antigen, DR-1 beta chain [Bagarius yarrelli]|uniref:DLA class II histocompatibility antigen, DR-1 beta chain n=1 Tax=Bagarius yarrelli TaxID=175774 RepID=A0A556VUF4_BAGYA|nr:DLA class II histocompatibility antigen, DR-1 beta chain [Bagarius yarrelli]